MVNFNNTSHFKRKKNSAIFFIQWNSPDSKDYQKSALFHCLQQAAKWCPETPIFFIADCNPGVEKPIEFISYCSYASITERFEKIYRHSGSNDPRYNRFCIDRWFVIKKIMQERSITHCIHLDSDVMVFSDLEIEFRMKGDERIAACGLDFSSMPGLEMYAGFPFYSFHTCSVPITALNQFQFFTEELFRDFKLWHQHLETFSFLSNKAVISGVNDMSLWSDFLKRNPHWNPLNLCLFNGNSIADFNSNASLGFEMDGDFRRYEIINGQPHAFLASNSEKQRHITIHFQGASKKLINKFKSLPTYQQSDSHRDFI